LHNSNLQSLLALRPAAANAPSLRALQVLGRDPALVESTSLCAAGDSRAVSTNDGDLVGGIDFLALAGGARGALAALAAAAFLGEEGGDPGVVDEVADTTEGGEEEEVEEDAARRSCVNFEIFCCRRFRLGIFLHLRVEPAHGSLDDTDSLVVDLASVDLAGGGLEHGGDVQAQVLRVHLSRERVGESLVLAGRDGDAIALGGQVAQNGRDLGRAGDIDGSGEGATNDQNLDGLGFLVVDVEDGAGGVAVDELDAEDLCLREGGLNVDVDVGRLLLAGVLDVVLDTLDFLDLGSVSIYEALAMICGIDLP
jgi:hypothetical protein